MNDELSEPSENGNNGHGSKENLRSKQAKCCKHELVVVVDHAIDDAANGENEHEKACNEKAEPIIHEK